MRAAPADPMQFDTLDFYREHTLRYSQLSHEYTHCAYTASSHPGLEGDLDLLKRVAELTPGKRGLDAGCGAGARDVYLLHTWGYDVHGIDAAEAYVPRLTVVPVGCVDGFHYSPPEVGCRTP